MFTPQPEDKNLPLKPIPRRKPNIHTASPSTIFARLSGSIGIRNKGVDSKLIESESHAAESDGDYMSCVALDLSEEAVHHWPGFLRTLSGDLCLARGSLAALITREKETYLLFKNIYDGKLDQMIDGKRQNTDHGLRCYQLVNYSSTGRSRALAFLMSIKWLTKPSNL
jgi:hypothetical protein